MNSARPTGLIFQIQPVTDGNWRDACFLGCRQRSGCLLCSLNFWNDFLPKIWVVILQILTVLLSDTV